MFGIIAAIVISLIVLITGIGWLLYYIITSLDELACDNVQTTGTTCFNHVGVCSRIKNDANNNWKELTTLPEADCKIPMLYTSINRPTCDKIVNTCSTITE